MSLSAMAEEDGKEREERSAGIPEAVFVVSGGRDIVMASSGEWVLSARDLAILTCSCT